MRTLAMLAGAAACMIAAGCASTEDARALRRPPLPPRQIALAERVSPLFESVAIYEILGAPEFRLIDGENDTALISTRPTRRDVAHMLRTWLASADMLAEDIAHSKYLLTVSFEDLHGPDLIPFSDKTASATARYVLTDRVAGHIVFDETYDAQMQARMPGVTPEMGRAALESALLAGGLAYSMPDSNPDDIRDAGQIAGAFIGMHAAALAGTAETLLWDWPAATLEVLPRIVDGAGLGLAVGSVAGEEFADADIGATEALWMAGGVGALTGLVAAAPRGRAPETWESTDSMGSFWGATRREQAVTGMMRQNFNRFLFGLEAAEMIAIRRAVTCDELNPDGYGPGIITTTRDAVAYDCPIGPRAR